MDSLAEQHNHLERLGFTPVRTSPPAIELSLEAGGGLGVGLSNYESDLSGTDESSSSTSFEAGINIKSVYHLSEHLDLIATFAFIFSRVPVVADDQQGDSDDAIAVDSYAFSPLGLRLKFYRSVLGYLVGLSVESLPTQRTNASADVGSRVLGKCLDTLLITQLESTA